MAHPHLWVRLAATQLIGFVLAGLNEQKILHLLENPEQVAEENGYLYSDPIGTLRSLSLDLAAQLQPDMEFEELADQVVKNLVFVARVMKDLKIENREEKKKKDESGADDEQSARDLDISILWLLRRMRKCVNIEITQAPKSTSAVIESTNKKNNIFSLCSNSREMFNFSSWKNSIIYNCAISINAIEFLFLFSLANGNVQMDRRNRSDHSNRVFKVDIISNNVASRPRDVYDRRIECTVASTSQGSGNDDQKERG